MKILPSYLRSVFSLLHIFSKILKGFYVKVIFVFFVFLFPFLSHAKEWTFLTKNTSGLDFFIDYNSFEKNGDNILFWYLSNRKTPDKWGSLSTAVLREADCKNMRFKSLRYAYYYGTMGTNLEKYANSTNMQWVYPKFKSVNEVMLNAVCKKSGYSVLRKPKKTYKRKNTNDTPLMKVAKQADNYKMLASKCYLSIPKAYQGGLARMYLNANDMYRRGVDMIKSGNTNIAKNMLKNANGQYQAFINAGKNVGGRSC